MKKIIFFVLSLFLLVGAVSASENITDTVATDSDVADANDSLTVSQKDTAVSDDSSKAETPTITVSDVKGTAGKRKGH